MRERDQDVRTPPPQGARSPEPVVDSQAHDARFKADRGVYAACGCAAGGAAEIGIKIFNLRGPWTEKRIFEAYARGPPRAVYRRGGPARNHLDVAECAARCGIKQRAIERVSDTSPRRCKPAGLD